MIKFTGKAPAGLYVATMGKWLQVHSICENDAVADKLFRKDNTLITVAHIGNDRPIIAEQYLVPASFPRWENNNQVGPMLYLRPPMYAQWLQIHATHETDDEANQFYASHDGFGCLHEAKCDEFKLVFSALLADKGIPLPKPLSR